MGIYDEINEIRKEYKAYLIKKHPNWSKSTLNTRISDTFFILNNKIISGFWGFSFLMKQWNMHENVFVTFLKMKSNQIDVRNERRSILMTLN